MQKAYFHNYISTDNNKNKSLQTLNLDIKKVVDINILLNKVKLEKKNEIKQKIIFSFTIIFLLISFGTFITIIK